MILFIHITIAVLVLFQCTLGANQKTRLRKLPHPFDRMGLPSVNNIAPRQYPFVVRIVKPEEGQDLHVASGCIVSPTAILSTCQAFFVTVKGRLIPKDDATSYTVIAGNEIFNRSDETNPKEEHVESLTQTRTVYRIEPHKDCFELQGIFRSDAAVFFLSDPLKWNRFVSPVKILGYTREKFLLKYGILQAWNSACSMFGWHRKSIDGESYLDFDGVANRKAENKEGPIKPFKSRVEPIPDDGCNFLFCSRGPKLCQVDFNAEGLTCAKASKFQTPSCGDFGGPLICNGFLYGVVTTSFCSLCEPVVLTKASIVWDLIADIGTHQSGDLEMFLSCANQFATSRLVITSLDALLLLGTYPRQFAVFWK